MGRKRKGRAISGWLVIDKPAGITSTSLVNKVRWAFEAQKAGHAGTLDPAATGVLAVALGEATKTVPYITDATKCYRFAVRWGAATTTDDAEGSVIRTSEARPNLTEINAALTGFRGQISQVPPQFSAVKVEGQRAYDLAREGEEMDLAARPLWVERLEVVELIDAETALLEMVCGKGGYVRSIARDLGETLGCFGHVLWLRREWSGPFDVRDAMSLETLDQLARSSELEARLLPLQVGLADLPEVKATDEGAVRLRNGNAGQIIGALEWGTEAWVSYKGVPLAVGYVQGGELQPNRVFNL